MEVARKLVTVKGMRETYGAVVDEVEFSVNEEETKACREKMVSARDKTYKDRVYDRGGSLAELTTGLQSPRPQWVKDPYGPHVALPYVKMWYKTMRAKEDWVLQ